MCLPQFPCLIAATQHGHRSEGSTAGRGFCCPSNSVCRDVRQCKRHFSVKIRFLIRFGRRLLQHDVHADDDQQVLRQRAQQRAHRHHQHTHLRCVSRKIFTLQVVPKYTVFPIKIARPRSKSTSSRIRRPTWERRIR